ncbi:spermine oxidase-like isoform X1 [Lethenteron reissneri]|uniref:spermine oxidase-like isoform X1 n=1 Tax=Lethenteron reissneri TaxID=7753 RepID=UPI002AB70D18|nr:spermine oxidase-like isoform X1 [Lethenteron reissneri]
MNANVFRERPEDVEATGGIIRPWPRSGPRILIIGCGLAGLGAAVTLAKSGVRGSKLLVLEALERAGGRVHTARPFRLGHAAELGAAWIHGENGNPLYRLAQTHGLLATGRASGQDGGDQQKDRDDHEEYRMCEPSCYLPDVDHFFTERGERLPSGTVSEVCKRFSEIMGDAFGETDRVYGGTGGTEAPSAAAGHRSVGDFLDEKFFSSSSSSGSWDEASKGVFEWCKRIECTDEACSSMYDFDLSELGHYSGFEGRFFNSLGPRGFSAIVDTLVDRLPVGSVIFNKAVSSIHWGLRTEQTAAEGGAGAHPVRVVCEDGSEFHADHVIVTVSLGYLKTNGASMFHPPLPPRKLRAIERLGFGAVSKIFLEFERPFWPHGWDSMQFVWNEGPEDRAVHDRTLEVPAGREGGSARAAGSWQDSWYKKITGFNSVARHPNVLCGWVTGREARHMDTLESSVVGDVCVRLLRQFTRLPVSRLVQVLVTTWNKDRFFQGAYTYIPLGVNARTEQQALAEPVPGRRDPQVLFAGEATDVNFYTTTHGALMSGRREAQRLLNRYTPPAAL